jgi:NADH-quinone oxidoreductase chain I
VSWIKTITLYDLLVGMKTTMSHMLHYKPITMQYPHEKRTLPDNYRGMLALLQYDDGTKKCVGCDLCEAACPSRVIRVVSAEVPGEPTKRYAKEYYMDMTRCLFCGLCVDACPVDAFGMTREFEWSCTTIGNWTSTSNNCSLSATGRFRFARSSWSSNTRMWGSSTLRSSTCRKTQMNRLTSRATVCWTGRLLRYPASGQKGRPVRGWWALPTRPDSSDSPHFSISR